MITTIAATAALLGLPTICLAQWTFAGYVGDAWTSSSTMTIADASAATAATLSDVAYESRSWNPPLYWGVRAARAVTRDQRWWIEFEYTHLKAYATPDQVVHIQGSLEGSPIDEREPFRGVVERFALSHGLNLLLVNVAWERPLDRRLSLVLRGGLGPTIPHIEARIAGVSREEYTSGRICAQAAAAINLDVTRYLFLTGEIKQTYTRQHLAVGSVSVEAPFNTTHIIAAAGIRIPPRSGTQSSRNAIIGSTRAARRAGR